MEIQNKITLEDDFTSELLEIIEHTKDFQKQIREAKENVDELNKIKATTQIAVDNKEAIKEISETRKQINEIKKNISFVIAAKDSASESMQKIKLQAKALVERPFTAVIKAKDEISSVISSITDKIFSLKTLATGIILGRSGKEAFDLTIGNAMSNEQYLSTLQTVLHSNQEGSSALQWSYKEAANTPFDASQVVAGVTQLATSGLDFKKYLEPLGDAAAAFNKPLEQAIFAMGKLKSGQLGMGVDMLRDFGISNTDWMKTGATFSKNGELQGMTGDQATEVALKMLQSKYGGLMSKQSGTAQGMISNIGDTINGMGRGLAGIDQNGQIMKGGLFDNFKKQLEIIMPLLNKIQESKAFSSLQKDIGELATTAGNRLTQFLKGFDDPEKITKYKNTLKQLIDDIKVGAGVAKDTAQAFVSVGSTLRPLIELVAAHPKVFLGLFAGLEAGKGTFGAISAINGIQRELNVFQGNLANFKLGIINTFSSIGTFLAANSTILIISGIAIAVGILAVVIRDNWSKISPVLSEAGKAIKTFFQPIIGLMETVGGKISSFAGSQVEQISGWLNSNSTLIQNTIKIIQNTLKSISDPIRNEVGKIYSDVQPVITKIGQYITTGIDKIRLEINKILTGISGIWKMHSKGIEDIIKNAWSIVTTIISTSIKAIEDVLKLGMQVINGDWKGAWVTIKDLVRNIFGGVSDIVSDIWKSVLDVFQGPYETLKKNLIDLKDNVVKGINDKVKELTKTYEDHKTAINVTAGILTTIFGPALLLAGARAATAGTQIAVHFIVSIINTGKEAVIAGLKITLSFIASMAKAALSAVVNGIKITASFVAAMITAGAQAVIAGLAITVSFVAAIARAGLEAALAGGQIIIGFVASLIRVALQAVITAGAITINLIGSLIPYAVEGWITVGVVAAQTLAWVIQKGAILASATATGILTGAQWLLNAALDANPIGVVILALAGLGLAIAEVVKHWKEICEWIENAWNWLTKWNDTNGSDKTVSVKGQSDNMTDWKVGTIPGKALGTTYFEGGPTWIAENGPEIVELPAGSKVYNNSQTMRMLNGAKNVMPDMNFTSGISNKSKSMAPEAAKWGEDIPEGMAKGIKANTKSVTDATTFMATKIKELIHFSVPDKGPLSDADSYGPDLMKTYGTGIQDNIKSVTTPTTNMSTGVKTIYTDLKNQSLTYGQGIVQELGAGIQSNIGNLTSIVKALTDKVIEEFKTGFGIHSPSRVFYKLAQFIPQGIINSLKDSDIGNFIKKWIGDISAMAGGAVSGNLSGWITAAMALTGVGADWFSPLATLIQHESGGDPMSINLWDSNAAAGHPSKGLMQLIDENMQDWHLPGMDNIYDPVSNIAAGIRLILHDYGSIYNVPGIRALASGGAYVGYATGTDNAKKGLARINERGWEFVDFTGGESVLNNVKSVGLMEKAASAISSIKNSIASINLLKPMKKLSSGDKFEPLLNKNKPVTINLRKDDSKQKPNITIAKLADQIIVREESDIDEIATALAKKLTIAEMNI